ncbi:MAG: hypothetical protein JSS54_13415 [Proteobacteria bacterium]|nr:hypothetical protein [Pseudomonadota bacterium]
MRMLIAVCVLALSSLDLHADAIPRSEVQVGNWQIAAYTFEHTSQFSHCVASTRYVSGTRLTFAIDASGSTWRVGLSNDAWQLPAGGTYPIRYFVDRDVPISATAKVIPPNMAVFELPSSSVLFQHFKSGRTFFINAIGQTFSFDLTSSSKALAMTLQCTTYHRMTATAPSTNPFASGGASSQDSVNLVVSPDPNLQQEAISILNSALSSANVSGFNVAVPPPEFQNVFHATFIAPGLVGGIALLPSVGAQGAIEASLTNASRGCGNGSFASARKPSENAAIMISTICKNEKGEFAVDYVAGPRNLGGSNLMTLIHLQQPSPTSPEKDGFNGADMKPY